MNENRNGPRPGSPDGDEQIGELLRSAGRRATIPDDDLAAIRQATDTAWQTMASRERARRFRRRGAYALAASLLLAALGAWWWMAQETPVAPREIATVELALGRIEAFRAGDPLSSGDTVQTAGGNGDPAGRLALRMAGGQSVRLDEGTRLRLVSRSLLELERGGVYVDSGPAVPDDASLEIVTPLGRVREIGTQYEVRLANESGRLRVRVREGSVSVRRDGETHAAERGEELTLGRDGPVERSTLAPDSAEWMWVLGAAPSLEIEGRSLDSFLTWVSRETGRQVRYADAQLEQSARTIRLHGTIEGLRPDESIGVILEGSGLSHRTENGTILVTRP